MAPRVRRSRNSRGRSKRSATGAVRTLRRQLHGASLRVPADPPSTVDRPWNSAVLVMPLTTLGNISISTVNTAFTNQIGDFSATPGILYRFLEVRAWELSGADIALSLFDFVAGGDSSGIRTQHDQSGRNHWARVGCAWPTTQQNDVCLSMNTTKNLFILESGASSPNVRAHLHLLWRFSGTPQPEKRQASLDFSKLPSGYSKEPTSSPEVSNF